MAVVTHRNTTTDNTAQSTYVSGSFTPAANELLVVFVGHNAAVASGSSTLTDSQGLGFTRFDFVGTSTDLLFVYVANALAAASSMTVSFNNFSTTPRIAEIHVAGVSGMTKTGNAAVVQDAYQSNVTSSGTVTPAPAFSAAVLTQNPTLGCVINQSNPAALTPPASWTEQADVGAVNTATLGSEYVTRDSGFSGTTITWGSTSPTDFTDLCVELDALTASTSYLQIVDRSFVW